MMKTPNNSATDILKHWEQLRPLNKSSLPVWHVLTGPLDITAGLSVSRTGDPMLVVQSPQKHDFKSKYKNLFIQIKQLPDGTFQIQLLLLDRKYEKYFAVLCENIFRAFTGRCKSEGAAVLEEQLSIWSSLLKTEGKKFTEEEERGLFAELEILSKYADILPTTDVLNAWAGPSGAHQDFCFTEFSTEVKSRFSNAESINISSLDQLDVNKTLKLAVVSLSEKPEGITIKQKIEHIKQLFSDKPAEYSEFVEKILMSGYCPEIGFAGTEKKYVVDCIDWFDTNHRNFPKICRSTLPPGILKGTYCISFGALSPFKTEDLC